MDSISTIREHSLTKKITQKIRRCKKLSLKPSNRSFFTVKWWLKLQIRPKSRLYKRDKQFVGILPEALTKSKTSITRIHNLIKINLTNSNNIWCNCILTKHCYKCLIYTIQIFNRYWPGKTYKWGSKWVIN
jgi:hypothetical protein